MADPNARKTVGGPAEPYDIVKSSLLEQLFEDEDFQAWLDAVSA